MYSDVGTCNVSPTAQGGPVGCVQLHPVPTRNNNINKHIVINTSIGINIDDSCDCDKQ